MQTDPIHALIPAAGVGRRMGGDVPKQYLELAGKTVLEHSIERLFEALPLSALVVATSEEDAYWPTLDISQAAQIIRCDGGQERADSVLNGLEVLRYLGADDEDWVLVHDAARPCVSPLRIQALLSQVLEAKACGGLLAQPVADTLKRAQTQESGASRVLETVERRGLWRAQTQQLFRLGPLYHALDQALAAKAPITDEASAMELAGFSPLLVDGGSDNLKITFPSDLSLAEWLLQSRA